MVSADRFGQGMTFDQYVAYTATPESLSREASMGGARRDWSGLLRQVYAAARLSETQQAAWKWLTAQPGGPARVLAISEEWSSDCRRDIPLLAKVADTVGLELRIFPRDGQRVGRGPQADPAESPNADLMNEFLRERDGRTYQSIPVVVFYTKDLEYLYHYTELPALFPRDRLVPAMQAARPGETPEQAWERFLRDWGALQQSPFFKVWASAAIDEMLSALYEQRILGAR
jgi:hypothetical protein